MCSFFFLQIWKKKKFISIYISILMNLESRYFFKNLLSEKALIFIFTRLLKEALSGNCHTVMIAHISPADRHFDKSRNTLVYADRAKNISNKVENIYLWIFVVLKMYFFLILDCFWFISKNFMNLNRKNKISNNHINKHLSLKINKKIC